MHQKKVLVGWRQVRKAVREVDECLQKEVLMQLANLSASDKLDLIDFKRFYARERDQIYIHVPRTECDILFGLAYGYIAAAELKEKQFMETVSHSIKDNEHIVVARIVG
jgi:hypothetical protein